MTGDSAKEEDPDRPTPRSVALTIFLKGISPGKCLRLNSVEIQSVEDHPDQFRIVRSEDSTLVDLFHLPGFQSARHLASYLERVTKKSKEEDIGEVSDPRGYQ